MASIIEPNMVADQTSSLIVSNPEPSRHRKILLVTMAAALLMLVSLVPMVIYVFYENTSLARTVHVLEQRIQKLEQHVMTSQMPRGPGADTRQHVTASVDNFQFRDVKHEDYDENYDDFYVSSGDDQFGDDDDDEFTFDMEPIQSPDDDEISGILERRRRDAPEHGKRHGGKGKEQKNKKKKRERAVKCLIQTKGDMVMDFKSKKESEKSRCQEMLSQYVESKISEMVPMTAIHLNGDIQVNKSMSARLRNNHDVPLEMSDRDGSMYYQGFMPNRQTMAFWSMAEWAQKSPRTNQTYHFNSHEGSVQVKKSGLYFIYAQVHFHETQAYLGYHVKHASGGAEETAFSCFTGVDPIKRQPGEPTDLPLSDYARHESCNLSGMLHLQELDTISLVNFVGHSKIDTTRQTSYWGMVHLSGMG